MTTEYLPRREAPGYLAGLGFPCAEHTLANYASQGCGPEMVKFGSRVYYSRAALDRWVAERAVVRRDTSDPGRRLSIFENNHAVAEATNACA